MTTTNTGKAYERLTLQIFEALLAQQRVKNLRLEHDIRLRGITNEHQIDVYWEFEAGGITYRTVVECKDWREPVDQGTLFALQTVLQDLPGQPRGVVAARSGFQEGAVTFAKAHGIVLNELRAPRDQDWEGFITSVSLEGQLLLPKIHAIDFKVDGDWLALAIERGSIPSIEAIPRVRGKAGNLIIEREDGSCLTTVARVVEACFCPTDLGPPEWREHLFTEPAYVATGLSGLPRILLRGLRASVELVVAYTQNIEVRLEPLVGLILKDVAGGDFSMFDSDGHPLEPGAPRPGRIRLSTDASQGE